MVLVLDDEAGIRRIGRRFLEGAGYGCVEAGTIDAAIEALRTTKVIAAILPVGTISVHTVFCLRTELPVDEQNVLCALLNSFVANYLVRRWVTTHVTASIVERLPVPRLPRNTPQFDAIAAGAARLRAGERTSHLVADVHAQAARAYGINGDDYTYILDSFPLVPAAEREAALRAFTSGTLR